MHKARLDLSARSVLQVRPDQTVLLVRRVQLEPRAIPEIQALLDPKVLLDRRDLSV